MVVEVAVDGEPVSFPPGPCCGREPAPLAHSRGRAAEGPGQGSAVMLLLALGLQSAALVTRRTWTQERTGHFRRYLHRNVVTDQSHTSVPPDAPQRNISVRWQEGVKSILQAQNKEF